MNKKVLHSVIDHITETHKESVAIEEEDRKLSYGRLRSYSNRIGHNLLSLNVKRGEAVGVFLETGIDYISSILGINKSGGMFMPLELSYPVKRLAYLLETVRPSIIISQKQHIENLLKINSHSNGSNVIEKILVLSGDNCLIEIIEISENKINTIKDGLNDGEEIELQVDGEDSNYILYTSGSTGRPKIIEGCHKSLSHFIHWEKSEFNLDESVRVSQLAPLSFDVSLRDIFVPLICGGTLCIPKKDTRKDAIELLNWIEGSKITLIHTVPSIFRLITKALKDHSALHKTIEHIVYILLAGEALYGRDVMEWRSVAGEKVELVNLYGPTETTLAKIYNRIGNSILDPSAIIPLGKPITNTAIIIISDNELCDPGIIGEIYIKTPFRSKGYYKDDVQTRERFIQNPLHNDFEDIVYRTGDLGRYHEDKYIEFLGREDGQIKIRGNRVELLEVEKVLMGCPGIKQVVVISIKKSDEDILACYYVEQQVEESFLRQYIKEYLPEYMHPSYYILMEEFPLNLNGKIDKRSLPRPEELLYEKLNYEAPLDELEESLAGIWSEILGLKKVGVLNSFFELGGHSLTATRAVSRIYKDIGKQISLKDFFDHPTIRSLSNLLRSKMEGEYQSIESVVEQEHYNVTHAQKRLWIIEQLNVSIAYNMLGGCYINTALDKEAFNKVFQTIVSRHESLRTTFIEIDSEVKQKIHSPSDFNFQLAHYDLTLEPSNETRIIEIINSEQITPFDLRKGPLLRSKLIQLQTDKYLFLFNMHHIISDGWSMSVLIKEILVLYESYIKREEDPLPALRIQYKDYATWQNEIINNSTKNYKGYWHEKLAGELPVLKLPVDYKRPGAKTYAGDKHFFKLSKEISDGIRKLCLANESSLFMFFISIINLELSNLSGQKDIILGSPIAGRNHPDLENQIGFYLNNLILRNEVDRTLTFKEFLLSVKRVTLGAYENQEYPFDKLVEELKPESTNGRNPFYDVLLVMNNSGLNGNPKVMDQLQGILGVSELNIQDKTSKLDLSFFINDDPQIFIVVEYSTELFRNESIEKIVDDLNQIINVVLDNNEINMGDLAWAMSGANREELSGSTIKEISENF